MSGDGWGGFSSLLEKQSLAAEIGMNGAFMSRCSGRVENKDGGSPRSYAKVKTGPPESDV